MDENLIEMRADLVFLKKKLATQAWDGGDNVEQSVDCRLFHWCKFSANQEEMQLREETDSAAAGSCDLQGLVGRVLFSLGKGIPVGGRGGTIFTKRKLVT